ncbi:hypothetical protein [uncultured Ruminococcus sp.]|uniref:hypothetical protein n=1 Tax=uncultured Ruminococcus sp. TaxID=165186 RepID=UPI0025EE50A1|nr:hypothetical protein [uncultured Ruminococcus sp.]
MILIDLGIICLGQTKRTFPRSIPKVRYRSHVRREDSAPMYDEWYHFEAADRLTGIWYLAWLTDDIFLEQSMFDIAEKGSPNIYVVPEWEDTVRELLGYYLKESPIHRIAVLLRIQDRSENVTHEECTLDEFMEMLRAGDVRWNELYHIGG